MAPMRDTEMLKMKTIATTVTLVVVSLASLVSLGLSEILPGKAVLLLAPLRVVATVVPFAAARGASLAARFVPRAWQAADAAPVPCRRLGPFMSEALGPAGTSCAAHSGASGSSLPGVLLAALAARIVRPCEIGTSSALP